MMTSRIVGVLFMLALGSLPCSGQPHIKSLDPAPLEREWVKSWWMKRHEERLTLRNTVYDVVMIGDSITHFFESGSGSNVWKRCFEDAGIRTFNLGFGGDATENVLWRIYNGELDGLDPRVAVIEVGVNNRENHGADETVEDTYLGIRAVLAAVRRKLPNAKIVLQAMMPLDKDSNSTRRQHAFAVNARTKSLADGKDVCWLDIGNQIMNKDGTISTEILYDYVHPTERGYEIWAEALMPMIRNALLNVVRFEDERGVFAEMTRPDPSVIDLKVERQGDFTVLTVAPAKGAKREVRELALPEIRIVREIANARTLGSGGLKSLGEDVGSYTFLAVAEPQTRKGIVAAFATSETGSGVIFSESRDGRAVLKPVLHYGRLRLGDGETVKGETFLVGAFNDCREGLECYGDYVAAHYGVELKRQPSGYCTYYSDKFDHSGTEESTKVFMEQSDKLIPWGFDFYQIDGSWQNGEKAFQLGQPKDTGPINRRFTDHDPDGTYPHGMKDAARTIAAKGATPGLWFMPFSANTGDSWFNDKRDLFVTSDVARKRPADPAPDNYRMNQVPGAPYETFWGGTAFDMTNPKTCRYVEDEIRNMTRNWGYRYLKYDGIWVAMACEHIYISDAYREDDIGFQTFFDPKATNISAFRRGAELVRKAAGDGTFLLGCNCAQNMRIMAGAYGLVDAMRIGPDNNASWDGVCRGPIRGTPRYFLNGRVWYNDPDPVYVRNSIPASRARNSATWVSLSGSLYAFSDWLPDLSAERLDILRRTLAPHRRPTKVRPVDLFESDLANTWLLADGESRIFGFFNWDEKKSLSIDYDTKYAGLDPKATYVGFDFWNNRFVEPFRGKIKTEVGAGDAKVWQLREFDGTRPVLVSTSRHIASPLFEVAGETWDADNCTLSGLSEIVLDDPYELRIVMPEGFVVESAEIAGTKAEVGVEYRAVRICVTPRRSGAAEWCIRFASTR